MKPSLKLLVVAMLFVSHAAYVMAQHKETTPAGYVELTPVRLTLGMPKDRTITLLSEHYDVSPWKGGDIEDTWGVSEKTGHHFLVGTLSFVNGVLIRATRMWNVEWDSRLEAKIERYKFSQLRAINFYICIRKTSVDLSHI